MKIIYELLCNGLLEEAGTEEPEEGSQSLIAAPLPVDCAGDVPSESCGCAGGGACCCATAIKLS